LGDYGPTPAGIHYLRTKSSGLASLSIHTNAFCLKYIPIDLASVRERPNARVLFSPGHCPEGSSPMPAINAVEIPNSSVSSSACNLCIPGISCRLAKWIRGRNECRRSTPVFIVEFLEWLTRLANIQYERFLTEHTIVCGAICCDQLGWDFGSRQLFTFHTNVPNSGRSDS
jgi:hypothetical protein